MEISAEQQPEIDALCRRSAVRALPIFGSAAVGSQRTHSDVDLLVNFTPGQAPTAFEWVDRRDALSGVFGGRAVDLAFEGLLDNPLRRRAIEPQLRSLYPADAAA